MELIGETRVCTVCGNCHRKVHASKIELEVC